VAQYAQIVEIVAPSQALPGERVDVTVRIKNTYSAAIGVMAVGVPEYSGVPGGEYINGLNPQQATANIDAGVTYSFSGYFYMPDKAATIHAYSYWYGADSAWHFDDDKTKPVSLATLTPQISEFKIADFTRV